MRIPALLRRLALRQYHRFFAVSRRRPRRRSYIVCPEQLELRQLLTALTIAQENALPGTPSSQWYFDGTLSTAIQGFATQMSVNHGQTIQFKIDSTASAYHLDIYRLGYYGGDGARLVTTIQPSQIIHQPNPIVDATAAHDSGSAGLVDCGNWSVTASWNVPVDATSGVYFAKLVRDDGGSGTNYIVFVVRNDESNSDLLFKTSDETWEAYNNWGNSSLYGPGASDIGRSFKVSYNRPLVNAFGGELDVFDQEASMVNFVESNGYNVSYISGVDVATQPALLAHHKVFMSVGHDEYWSGAERTNIENARDSGLSLVFASGNEMFWKTYWAPSIGGPNTANRTLVCYKETHDDAILDPVNPNIWTGTWADPRFSPPADGGRPQNAVTGTFFVTNYSGPTTDTITVTSDFSNLRFWRNTSVAALRPGQSIAVGNALLGGEWDSDLDNGFRPAGEFDLTSTTLNEPAILVPSDYGHSFAPGTATHNLTLYRAASGALVFGAGTDEWAFALDGTTTVDDPYTPARSPIIEQAMVNLFADMGAQPTTLMTIHGIVAATQSTDFTAPVSTITAPSQGAILAAGVPFTIQGTAQDSGGGVLAAVEISVDGGTTWHRATGTTSWAYTWTPLSSGTVTIKSRAVDDSGNIETPSAGVTVNPPPPGGSQSATYSLWNNATTPPTVDGGDGNAVELGVKFRTDSSGYVTGVRFYKSSANTGTHTGSLWTTSGQLLATGTFTGESNSGWQQLNFSSPVAIAAGTTYIVSYHTNTGHYSSTQNYFTSTGVDSGPVHALASGVAGGNGVYLYGSGGFPASTFQDSNYWVDVVFSASTPADTTAPTVTAFNPTGGATGISIGATPVVTFSEALTTSTVTTSTVFLQDASNNVIPTTLAYNATAKTVTLTPTAALANSATYTIVVKGGASGVKDLAGNALAADATSSFTTLASVPVDTVPPTVTAFSPTNAASNVATTPTITVTFSESLDQTTVNANTVFLRNSSNVVVSTTLSYNSAANTATLTPTSALANSATYTIVVKGGSSGVKDLAGNALAADATSSFTTVAAAVSTTSSLFGSSTTPAIIDSGDTQAVELGVKFTSTTSGYITGIRFYKSSTNTGTHTGTLWSASGQQLATATFTSESGSGWQQVTFNTPVAITAGTTYVASYHTNSGHYSVSRSYFTSTYTSGPLQVAANGGTYLYGTGGFPTNTYQSSNYFVDVVFTTTPPPDTTAPTVTAFSPANGTTNVATTSAATVTFSEAVNAATVTSATVFLRDTNNNVVATSIAYNSANRTVTLTPTAALVNAATYTIVVKGGVGGVQDLAGNALVADVTSSFTTAAVVTSPPPSSGPSGSLFGNSVPSIVDSGDARAVELGVKFTPSKNGYISAIRFYKSPGNTGLHTATLWDSSGRKLGTAVFVNETASGWQTAYFSKAIAVRAGLTYTASYYTTVGHYSLTPSYFATAFTNGYLKVPTNGGVYRYGTSGFPKSGTSSNYFVDVIFS